MDGWISKWQRFNLFYTRLVICSSSNTGSVNPDLNARISQISGGLFKSKDELIEFLQSEKIEKILTKLNVTAQSLIDNPDSIQKILPSILEVSSESFGVALAMLASGLFIAYMGNRLFKAFLTISGMIVGGGTSYFGYQKLAATFPFLIPTEWPYLPYVVFALGALLGSLLFVKAWNLGTYALSASGGVMLAVLVKGMISKYEFSDKIDRNILMAIFGVLGLFFARLIRDTAIICASSLSGAFLIFLGLDNLKSVGFRKFIKDSIACNEEELKNLVGKAFEGEIAYCLLGVIFVTVTGIYVQIRNKSRARHYD